MNIKLKPKIIAIILTLAVAIKIALYYGLMNIDTKFQAMTMLTFLFVILIYFSLQELPNGNKIFIGINLLISSLMFVNVIYYKYFNQNLSISLLNQANQLYSVRDIIVQIIKPWDFFLFFDIIPLYYFLNKLDDELNIKNYEVYKWKNKATIGIAIIIALISINPAKSDWVTSINNQEFFIYHGKDIYSTIFNTKSDISYSMEIEKSEEKKEDDYKIMELFGIARGRNLIVIQVESLQNMVINSTYGDQVITPNLNKLVKEDSLYFNSYYQQLGRGNTSDAEFVSHNSLYAPIYGQAYDIYRDNKFYGLPWILKDQGYETIALHGYKKEFWNRDKAYPAQGFDKFISEKDYELKESIGFGLGDREFFQQSIEYIKSFKQPFYSFLITLTSHGPYEIPESYKELILKEEDEDTLFGDYLNAIHYTDRAIGEFISYLKENDLYDNSIIAIYGDHFGLNAKDKSTKDRVSNYLGYEYDFDEMMRIPLVINIPGSEISKTFDTVGGQIDFMPTILNLMGIKNENPYVFGQDLVNADSGFIASQTYMLKGSFIQDDIVFEMSRDNVFNNSRAWNRITREPIDLEDCREGYERANSEINKSAYILENDMLKDALIEIEDISVIDSEIYRDIAISPEKYIAHAGGAIEEITYTNCKEALDESYKNSYKFIEVDFEWTSDGYPVLLHSWDGFVTKLFGVEPKKYSLEEFKSFNMINNWTQMDFEDLINWLENHPGVYIVTDVKEENIKLLSLIKEKYSHVQDQFIPQIYFMEEYIHAEYLGYKNIIYTLYRSNNTPEEIIDFASANNLLAVTMPIERAQSDLPKKLKESGVFTYSHTINDIELQKQLEKQGVDGFYTDTLKAISNILR